MPLGTVFQERQDLMESLQSGLGNSLRSGFALNCVFSLGKNRLRGPMINFSKYIKGCHKQEGNTFLLPMGIGTKCCQLKLQQGQFRIDIQGHFLGVRMVKAWNRLFRESKDSPFLRI